MDSKGYIFEDYNLLIDYIVDWKKRLYHEMPFFKHLFRTHNVRKLIDLSCGSGNHALEFSSILDLVIGIDNNPFLIKSAHEKNQTRSNLSFLNTSLDNFQTYLNEKKLPKKHHALLSFNNYLPLIMNDGNLINYLHKSRELLDDKGIIVISVFNYNKLLKNEDYSFNRIRFDYKKESYSLIRHMKIIDSDFIKYVADVYNYEGSQIVSFEQLHRPLTKKRLKNFLEQSGFKVLNFYGDCDFNDFNPDNSKRLIVVAKK